MIRILLNRLKDDLSRYLRMAEKEDIIITRHGVPAGILIGFEDPDAWWEELLLRDLRFRERVAQARQPARGARNQHRAVARETRHRVTGGRGGGINRR